MRTRCNNKERPNYKNYGGRGIRVCERWNDFSNFVTDMGTPPEGMSIDRILNDGNYSPDNCRWATPKEQNNNARWNRQLTIAGVTLSMSQWSEKTGISEDAIWARLKRGWSEAEAVSTPPRSKRVTSSIEAFPHFNGAD
jgi:hypothetical protein